MRGSALVLLAACSGKPDVPAATGSAEVPREAAPIECTDLPFADTTPVPEASGAAWLDVGGKPALLVVADSGNHGKYAIVDADGGATIEEGTLPLGATTDDDIEGVAVRGGRFYTLTSPGWIRAYQRTDRAFDLVDGPYALGPIDLDDTPRGMGGPPPKGTGMVCAAKATNCGRNYEGICLAPDTTTTARCIGFAAAKADGHLYCLIEDNGRLVVHYEHSIRITRPSMIADCAFSDDGRLYVGSNVFELGDVYRVDNWQTPDDAKVTKVAALPVGNAETLAVRGDVFYRMSDTGVAPSMMRKVRCR